MEKDKRRAVQGHMKGSYMQDLGVLAVDASR